MNGAGVFRVFGKDEKRAQIDCPSTLGCIRSLPLFLVYFLDLAKVNLFSSTPLEIKGLF